MNIFLAIFLIRSPPYPRNPKEEIDHAPETIMICGVFLPLLNLRFISMIFQDNWKKKCNVKNVHFEGAESFFHSLMKTVKRTMETVASKSCIRST